MNWASRSTASTLDRQDVVERVLRAALSGLTVRELAVEVGISRQLALYHVKKLVAAKRIAMMLEPCAINGQLQFRVWHPTTLARHYASQLTMAERVDAYLQSHAA
jgi:hypothetical protein